MVVVVVVVGGRGEGVVVVVVFVVVLVVQTVCIWHVCHNGQAPNYRGRVPVDTAPSPAPDVQGPQKKRPPQQHIQT